MMKCYREYKYLINIAKIVVYYCQKAYQVHCATWDTNEEIN